ncbi:putative SAWADEE domain-containing protein [Tanacetum coccineum]
MSEKEVLMRIRVRSLPLLEDDCTRIKPGDRVVCQNSQKGFFDAEIEKVLSVRHSKRAQCRCKFIVKWLHHDLDGKSLTVASSSVMRLANKSINDHPTISAFLESVSLSNSCFSSMSPQLTLVNDFELDLDLHDLLEKQIEGIRNSVHGSKKRIRDEILGFEANIHEQVKETDIAVPNASDSEDIRSPLNPLAARAALASRMSKLSPESSPNISKGIDDISNNKKESLETEDAPKPQ